MRKRATSIQNTVQSDSIVARSQRSEEFCNTIGQKATFAPLRLDVCIPRKNGHRCCFENFASELGKPRTGLSALPPCIWLRCSANSQRTFLRRKDILRRGTYE